MLKKIVESCRKKAVCMTEIIAKTALYDLHQQLGAKLVPFAGFMMPVSYPMGVLKEHLHTRTQAGLFDVSHMGQIKLVGADAKKALETLVPVDIVGLTPGQQRYAFFTNEAGGILEDLMVANAGDFLFLVVNAACKTQDIAHLKAHLSKRCEIVELTERSLLALQGPMAVTVLKRFAPSCAEMVFMAFKTVSIEGIECFVTRSGYTGEDGFELSIPTDKVEQLARLLLSQPEVAPIGLGARDSLRLEAGLCLYGHDLTQETSPVEASLLWAISKARRAGGERAGGFLGAETVLAQITHGVTKKRVGLVGVEKTPVREGANLVDAEGQVIGQVTSGGFGPSISKPIAMGYVESKFAVVDTTVYAMVREKKVPMVVTKMPFVPQQYYRG